MREKKKTVERRYGAQKTENLIGQSSKEISRVREMWQKGAGQDYGRTTEGPPEGGGQGKNEMVI